MKLSLGTKLALMSSKLGSLFFIGLMSAATSLTAFAAGETSIAGPDLTAIKAPIVGVLESVFNIMIPIVGAVGAIFCVFLGVKYSKAEEPQEREKAKGHLKAAIIGFVLIFILVIALRFAVPAMTGWMGDVNRTLESSMAAASGA